MKTGVALTALCFLSVIFWHCERETFPIEKSGQNITLKNSNEYRLDLNISGDEEGATITEQAKHYLKSELQRDASTNWSIVYVYQPERDFTGIDSVEIETCTGGDGGDIPCTTELIKLKFQIEN